jgi:hypothetical protein
MRMRVVATLSCVILAGCGGRVVAIDAEFQAILPLAQ